MDCGQVRNNKEEQAKKDKYTADNKWWEEHINAIAKGKGKCKGFQGNCYVCGEHGHPMRNCPKGQNNYKGGKDQGTGGNGSNGEGGGTSKGKGCQGSCWTCGEFGHSTYNCPTTAGKGHKGGWGSKLYNHRQRVGHGMGSVVDE